MIILRIIIISNIYVWNLSVVLRDQMKWSSIVPIHVSCENTVENINNKVHHLYWRHQFILNTHTVFLPHDFMGYFLAWEIANPRVCNLTPVCHHPHHRLIFWSSTFHLWNISILNVLIKNSCTNQFVFGLGAVGLPFPDLIQPYRDQLAFCYPLIFVQQNHRINPDLQICFSSGTPRVFPKHHQQRCLCQNLKGTQSWTYIEKWCKTTILK